MSDRRQDRPGRGGPHSKRATRRRNAKRALHLESLEARQLLALTATSGIGTDPAALLPTVDAFRSRLGVQNPNQPGSFGEGRREINWDGVPDGSADPNPFPADFFNENVAGRARGVVFATPGSGFLVSADDDMRPYTLVEDSPESLADGELARDTAMDLHTNATQGLTRENSLVLQAGEVPDDAIVKIAQTFRSGTTSVQAASRSQPRWQGGRSIRT